jgi:hypothetical protein
MRKKPVPDRLPGLKEMNDAFRAWEKRRGVKLFRKFVGCTWSPRQQAIKVEEKT